MSLPVVHILIGLLFVHLVGDERRRASEESRLLLCHAYGSGSVRCQVETHAEVLVAQASGEVYRADVCVGAVIECHASAPPFF